MRTLPHQMRAQPPGMQGFSLIELMVAITIGLFITLGLSQMFLSMYSTASTQRGLADFQDNQRIGVTVLTNTMELEGYYSTPSASLLPVATVNADGSSFAAGTAIVGTTGTNDTVNIYYQTGGSAVDNIINCQGGASTLAATVINSFSINASNQLVCTVSSAGVTSAALVLATNVTGMKILYGVIGSAQTGMSCYLSAAQINASGAANWANVVSAQITLTLLNAVTNTSTNWVQTINLLH